MFEAVSTNGFSVSMKFVMAVGGLTTGVLLLLTSVLVWGFSAFENQNHDWLELIFIITAFLFTGIGAHFLDLLQTAKNEEAKRRLNL